MIRSLSALAVGVAVLGAFCAPAQAQLNNRPFAFSSSPGGLGMSNAGRQAILNLEIRGVAPDNLLRTPDGQLLTLEKGRGGSAIVSYENTGAFIPGYKGSSFRGTSDLMRAGTFNAFFAPDSGRTGGNSRSYAQIHSAALVDTWTGRVVTGYAPSLGGVVDTWTGLVYAMER